MDERHGLGRRAVSGLLLTILVAAACSAAATSQPATSDVATGSTASSSAAASAGDTPGAASFQPQASAIDSPGTTAQPATAPPATPAPPKATAKPTPRPTAQPTKSPPPAPSLVIRTEMTSLGAVLAGSDQLTFYISSGDGTNHSNCTGSCLANWPAVLVKAGTKVSGGPGVHGQFATFKRADGTTQVSYKGHPLYTFPGDAYPGDTTGQGLGGFTVAKP